MAPDPGPFRRYLDNEKIETDLTSYAGALALPIVLEVLNIIWLIFMIVYGSIIVYRRHRSNSTSTRDDKPAKRFHRNVYSLALILMVLLSLSGSLSESSIYNLPSCLISRITYETNFGTLRSRTMEDQARSFIGFAPLASL